MPTPDPPATPAKPSAKHPSPLALRRLVLPLLGDRCITRGADVLCPSPQAAVILPLSKGRGRFGRLRPKPERGLPRTQARITQRPPSGRGLG